MYSTQKIVSIFVLALFFAQTLSCGAILYPERNGQQFSQYEKRKLDVGVIVLDGVGMFFFLVPGVIAFAVDFITGTIYLPSSEIVKKSQNEANLKDVEVIYVDPDSVDFDKVREIIQIHTGKTIPFDSSKVLIYKADDDVDIARELNKLKMNYYASAKQQ